MNISVVGTGYVGLVTGVSLSEIGHHVTCVDVDSEKVEKMKKGISPIYEAGLSELILKNLDENRLRFTTNHQDAFKDADAIYIAVGTPENLDGSANLTYINLAAKEIAQYVCKDVVVVTKSTVPVGTNHQLINMIREHLVQDVNVEIVSNPEFLKEGSAIEDSFKGDRIIIGAESEEAFAVVEEINKPFEIPIYRTDIKSAEMIKYASNAFLATKISFINEISTICKLLGANVENVAYGMGLDSRIGNQFLKAGIGYGGSCFPKDTKALIQIAGNVKYDFELLKGVVNVNKKQQTLVIDILNQCLASVKGKRIAVLGLAFKPETDDIREAPSILVTEELVSRGAEIIAYDPVAESNAQSVLDPSVQYAKSIEEAVMGSEAVLILTEWKDIENMDVAIFNRMKRPLVIDGRNCFDLDLMEKNMIEYHSVGRPSVMVGVGIT